MGRKNNGPTSQFVHDVEGPADKNRRKKSKILKREFRITAERAAEKIFGSKSGQFVVMKDEHADNTEKVIRSIIGISKPLDFNRMLEEFFGKIELIRETDENEYEKVKLQEPMALWGYLAASDDRLFRERATIATIEVLMATDDESIAKFFLQKLTNVNEESKMKMLEGIIDFAEINYIHTITAMSIAFITKPEEAANFITTMSRRIETRPSLPGENNERLYNDFLLSGIVKSNFGL